MEFRLATAEDILKVRQNPLHGEAKPSAETSELYHIFALEGIDGKILMTGGFQFITDTTAWTWIELSKEAETCLVTCFRVMKEWIEQYCKDNGIIRLQCFVDESFPQGIKLIEHLGFDPQSRHLMHRFMGDKSAWLYYRIMENE